MCNTAATIEKSLRHRVTSPPVFAFCHDCRSYLASAVSVLDLFLPVETVVRDN